MRFCSHRVLLLAFIYTVFAGILPGPVGAQALVGDCNSDRRVSIDELITGVNIALGQRSPDDCEALDANGDGRVSVDELVRAVNVSLRAKLVARGVCLQPGAGGLEPCAAGKEVKVSRCDNRGQCLGGSGGLALLDFGSIAQNGNFSLTIDLEEAVQATLVFEARIEPETRYRLIDFGPLALQGAGGGAQVLEGIVLSPISEAAVRLIEENGLENFDNSGVLAVTEAVIAANADTDFAGQTAAQAVLTALGVARQDATVQTILLARRTPSPTSSSATPSFTPTAVATASFTSTAVATATRTITQAPTPTNTQAPEGSPVTVFARAVGAGVREAPSVGAVALPENNMRTLTVTLLASPAASETTVVVSSTDPDIASVLGTVNIPAGSRAATFDVRTGSAGLAVLRFRAAGSVGDLRITVGTAPDDLPAVVAPDVGVAVQPAPFIGQVFIAGAGQHTLTLTILSTPAGSNTPVIVTSSDPGVADLIGTAMIGVGARATTLEIQTGSSGTAILRLRVGDSVRDLAITVAPPAEGQRPALTAPIVGVETQ